jgi:hypothetical protein
MLNLPRSRPASLLMPRPPPLLITPSSPTLLRRSISPHIQASIISRPPPVCFLPPSPPLPLPLLRVPRTRIPTGIPAPIRPPMLPSFPLHTRMLKPHLPQTLLPDPIHQPPIRIINTPLPQTHLCRRHPHKHVLPITILNPHILPLLLGATLLRIRSQEHLKQRRDRSIMFRIPDRRPTARTCIG